MRQSVCIELMEAPVAIGPATVYFGPVVQTGAKKRREAELQAVGQLVERVFGPGVTLHHDRAGSPYLSGIQGVEISVSHCRGVAALAVSRTGRIGVDVELESERLQRVAERFLSPSERAVYGNSTASLTQAWTVKEAVFKALGIDGLVISEIELDGTDVATARGVEARVYCRHFGPLHLSVACRV